MREFFERNKMLLIGMIGVVLLISFFPVQNVLLHYETGEEQYVVRLNCTAFGMCMRLAPGSKNTGNIVLMDTFTFINRTKSVSRAADALAELAQTKDGTFQLQVSGAVLNNEQVEADLIAQLVSMGYKAEILE